MKKLVIIVVLIGIVLVGCGAPATVRELDAPEALSSANPLPATSSPVLPTVTPTSIPADDLVITEPITMELVRVPAGEFLMGSDPAVDSYANEDDQPQHTVELPEVYIGKYEVTNTQYAAFVEATGHRTPFHWHDDIVPQGEENHPVVWINWDDAALFAEWLGDQTGMDIRLPSEAEWEKACRGTDGRLYPWGDSTPDAERVNYNGNVDATTQVGSYSPQGDSPYDLADMAGNVWEWTRTLFADYPYMTNDGREDLEASGRQVMRGGAFYWGDRKSVRCAERDGQWMVARSFRDDDVGFRVVWHP